MAFNQRIKSSSQRESALRTTLAIDEDALAAAKARARRQRMLTGRIISRLPRHPAQAGGGNSPSLRALNLNRLTLASAPFSIAIPARPQFN